MNPIVSGKKIDSNMYLEHVLLYTLANVNIVNVEMFTLFFFPKAVHLS